MTGSRNVAKGSASSGPIQGVTALRLAGHCRLHVLVLGSMAVQGGMNVLVLGVRTLVREKLQLVRIAVDGGRIQRVAPLRTWTHTDALNWILALHRPRRLPNGARVKEGLRMNHSQGGQQDHEAQLLEK